MPSAAFATGYTPNQRCPSVNEGATPLAQKDQAMAEYNEDAIREARENWHKTDRRTFEKKDRESLNARHNAVLDLLCAHIPVRKDETAQEPAATDQSG